MDEHNHSGCHTHTHTHTVGCVQRSGIQKCLWLICAGICVTKLNVWWKSERWHKHSWEHWGNWTLCREELNRISCITDVLWLETWNVYYAVFACSVVLEYRFLLLSCKKSSLGSFDPIHLMKPTNQDAAQLEHQASHHHRMRLSFASFSKSIIFKTKLHIYTLSACLLEVFFCAWWSWSVFTGLFWGEVLLFKDIALFIPRFHFKTWRLHYPQCTWATVWHHWRRFTWLHAASSGATKDFILLFFVCFCFFSNMQ